MGKFAHLSRLLGRSHPQEACESCLRRCYARSCGGGGTTCRADYCKCLQWQEFSAHCPIVRAQTAKNCYAQLPHPIPSPQFAAPTCGRIFRPQSTGQSTAHPRSRFCSAVEPVRPRPPPSGFRAASADSNTIAGGGGVELNFDGADIQTVAKSVLGDTLGVDFVVDPRVQGSVTLASTGPISRNDVLPVFESALRMSNVAVVRLS